MNLTVSRRAAAYAAIIYLGYTLLSQVVYSASYGKWQVGENWLLGEHWVLGTHHMGGDDPDLPEYRGNPVKDVVDAVRDIVTQIKIPPWGYWLIIGMLALVGVASVFAKGSRERKPRGVRRKQQSYTPHKKAAPARRLPKRDEKGRYRKR